MTSPLRREFAADASTPLLARKFVAGAVATLLPAATHGTLRDGVRDDLELVVSELVTNAVRAASPHVWVSVTFRGGCLVLGVEDDGDGWPTPRTAGVHDTSGRGLALVSAVCATWGVRLSGPGRKTVWAELEVAPG